MQSRQEFEKNEHAVDLTIAQEILNGPLWFTGSSLDETEPNESLIITSHAKSCWQLNLRRTNVPGTNSERMHRSDTHFGKTNTRGSTSVRRIGVRFSYTSTPRVSSCTE